jgi:hypothetical protein
MLSVLAPPHLVLWLCLLKKIICLQNPFGWTAEGGDAGCFCLTHPEGVSRCPKRMPQVLSFSASGHGKCEVDRVGAAAKSSSILAMNAGLEIKTAKELVAYLNKEVDGNKSTKDRVDTAGCHYIGMKTFLVEEKDVVVPNVDYSTVKDTRAIHQLVTTENPGELKVRKRGCYSCDNCRSGDLLNCTNPDCDGFWSVQMDRGTPHQQQAIAATRSRQNRRDLGHFFASTAQPGSLVAVALSESMEPALVNITKAAFAVDKDHIKCPTTKAVYVRGEQVLEGTRLKKVDAKTFTTIGSKRVIFHASHVKTCPLVFHTNQVSKSGVTNQSPSTLTFNQLFKIFNLYKFVLFPSP